MQPKDEDELQSMLTTGLALNKPVFIRYPRGTDWGVPISKKPGTLEFGKAEVVKSGSHISFGLWKFD